MPKVYTIFLFTIIIKNYNRTRKNLTNLYYNKYYKYYYNFNSSYSPDLLKTYIESEYSMIVQNFQ